VALAILAVVGVWPATSSAQLTVEQLEVVLVPRAATVSTFGVRNDGKRVVQTSIEFEDWERDERGGNKFFPVGTRAGTCGSLVRVFPSSLRLEPGQSGTVRVSLEGGDTLSKACWSVVFVENREPPAAAERQITYTVRTGVKIYVEPPNLVRDGLIEDMALVPHVIGDAAGLNPQVDSTRKDVAVAFRNTGGLQVRLKGSMEIRRPDNSLAHKIDVEDIPVLPGARRVLRLPLPDLPAGRYVILALLDYGGSEVAAGQLEHDAR
jgi:P pilus assembly chaperone PapD